MLSSGLSDPKRNSIILTAISIILDILSEFIRNTIITIYCTASFYQFKIVCISYGRHMHKNTFFWPRNLAERFLSISGHFKLLNRSGSYFILFESLLFKVSCYPHDVLTLSVCFKSKMNYLMVCVFFLCPVFFSMLILLCSLFLHVHQECPIAIMWTKLCKFSRKQRETITIW